MRYIKFSGIYDKNKLPNLVQKTKKQNKTKNPPKNKEQKRVDFAVPTDRWMKKKKKKKEEKKKKKKKSGTRDKYLDLDSRSAFFFFFFFFFFFAREQRKLWNKMVTVIPIVIGALGTIFKGFEKILKDWKSEDKSRQPWLQHFWGQPEF